MRVSDRMFFNAMTDRMQFQNAQLFRTQEQLSTGKKINRPSDDPIGQAAIIKNDKTLSEVDQFLRNISEADTTLSIGESTLQSIENQLLRARELAIQAANDTNSLVDRAYIASEVRQLYDQIVAVANTSQGGRYIFAGTETAAPPFVRQGDTIGTTVSLPVTIATGTNDQLTLSIDGTTSTVTLPAGANATGSALATMLQSAINTDTNFVTANRSVTVSFDTDHLVVQSNAVGGSSNADITGGNAQTVLGLAAGTNRPAGTYLGDSGESRIAIDKNTTVIKNIPGDRLIMGSGGGINVLAAVAGLQSALETNTPAGIQTALTNLSTASEQIVNERVVLGARLNRTATTSGILEDFKIVIQRLKSEQEDVELTEAISALVLEQNALEASRSLASRIFSAPTLMDFLR